MADSRSVSAGDPCSKDRRQRAHRFAAAALAVGLMTLTACTARNFFRGTPLIAEGSPESTGVIILDAEVLVTPDPPHSFSIDGLFSAIGDAVLGGPSYRAPIARAVMTGPSGEAAVAEVQQGVVLFSGLAPGTWSLESATTSKSVARGFLREFFECDPPETSVFGDSECPDSLVVSVLPPAEIKEGWSVQVEAGGTHYLGKIIVASDERPSFNSWRHNRVASVQHRGPPDSYHMDLDVKHEVAAIEGALDKMDPGPWNEVFRVRLILLRSAQRVGAANHR